MTKRENNANMIDDIPHTQRPDSRKLKNSSMNQNKKSKLNYEKVFPNL